MERNAPYVHGTFATVISHKKRAPPYESQVSSETGVFLYGDAGSSSNYEEKPEDAKASQRIVLASFVAPYPWYSYLSTVYSLL